MIDHDARPLNYTDVKPVSDTEMSDAVGGLGVPTLSISPEGRSFGHFGQPRGSFMEVANQLEDMAITNADTTTIALAEIGCEVPDGTTVDVIQRAGDVLEVTRNGHTFTVEIGLGRVAEVTLRNKTRPERVPDWLAALLKTRFDVREVRL